MICDMKSYKSFCPLSSFLSEKFVSCGDCHLAFQRLSFAFLPLCAAHWAELNMTWVASLLYSDVHHGNWDERSRKCFISASLVLICRHKDNIKGTFTSGLPWAFWLHVHESRPQQGSRYKQDAHTHVPDIHASFFFFLFLFSSPLLECPVPLTFCWDGALLTPSWFQSLGPPSAFLFQSTAQAHNPITQVSLVWLSI